MVVILPISCGALATNLLAMCCISHMVLSNGVYGGGAGISLTSSKLESSVALCHASFKSDIYFCDIVIMVYYYFSIILISCSYLRNITIVIIYYTGNSFSSVLLLL